MTNLPSNHAAAPTDAATRQRSARQPTRVSGSGHSYRRLGRRLGRRPAAALGLVGAFALLTATAWADQAPANRPTNMAEHGAEGLRIQPGQEARVAALVTPWRDGERVLSGVRWVGATIDKVRVCYAFEVNKSGDVNHKQTTTLCLVAPDAAERLPTSARRRAVGHNVVAVIQGPSTTPSNRLFDLFAARVRANAESAGLKQLWTKPPERTTPTWTYILLYKDVVVWLPALLLWLTWLCVRALQPLPGGGVVWTLVLLGVSGVLRAVVPIAAPMTAWSFSRDTRLGSLAASSDLMKHLLEQLGSMYFDDLQSLCLRLVSTFTPLAVAAHTSKLVRDPKAALAAGLLLACSPHHLRFSASDSQFIPSMLWTSSAFVCLYASIQARHLVSRIVHGFAFTGLLSLALTARPLNLIYAPLLLAALAVSLRYPTATTTADQAGHAKTAPGTRAAYLFCVAALIVGVAATVSYELLSVDGDAVAHGLNWQSLSDGLKQLLQPQRNPLLFFALTPPVWVPLMVAGAVLLLRGHYSGLSARAAVWRGAWLLSWLLGFIVAHGVVIVPEPLNNARYQLHALPAMAMLAGIGFVGLAKSVDWRARQLKPVLLAWIAVLALCAPALHIKTIVDRDFVTMTERALLQRWRSELPAGCVVFEVVQKAKDVEFSKLAHVGQRVGGGPEAGPPWKVEVVVDRLTPAQHKLLNNPPKCLAFYEGITCATGAGLPGRRKVCDAILAQGPWGLLEERRFSARVYDTGQVAGLRKTGDPVLLRMYRSER